MIGPEISGWDAGEKAESLKGKGKVVSAKWVWNSRQWAGGSRQWGN